MNMTEILLENSTRTPALQPGSMHPIYTRVALYRYVLFTHPRSHILPSPQTQNQSYHRVTRQGGFLVTTNPVILRTIAIKLQDSSVDYLSAEECRLEL